MNDDEEQYGISVSIWHPDTPKVEVKLSWPDEKSREVLTEAAFTLTTYALGISERMVSEADDDD